jgi:protein-tyrosine phosphatase
VIDLHNHILWGLDDGADTLAESIEMCRIGFQDGVRTIVATPHMGNGVYSNTRTAIMAKIEELNEILNGHSPSGGLKVIPGADVHFSEAVTARVETGEVLTLADGKKFILLEFPAHGIPYRAETVLFELIARGIIPIITHPERNTEICKQPRRYAEMIHTGCLGQVTAMSLTGGFGGEVRRVAEKLVKNRLVQFIATDAHASFDRVPVLSRAVEAAARIIGMEEAKKMVTAHPAAVLEGRSPKAPAPATKIN